MSSTPLHPGQLIIPSDDACARVLIVVAKNGKENLARGLLCEYAHNEAFQQHGMQYETIETTGAFDRRVDGVLQDDKLAMFGKYGLSETHTVTKSEASMWNAELEAGRDVIIQSFEEVSSGDPQFISRFRASLSYRKIKELGLIKSSQFDSTFYFYRDAAYRSCRAEPEKMPV